MRRIHMSADTLAAALVCAIVAVIVAPTVTVSAEYRAPTASTAVIGAVCPNHFQNVGPFHVLQTYTGMNNADNPEDIGAAHELWLSGSTAYLGAVNGGVWKASNFHTRDTLGGPHWVPTSDYMPCLNIGALSGSAADANFVVAGCGYVSNANMRGGEPLGVMITTNGATTWSMTEFPKGYSISSILVSGTPTGTHRIVVAARGPKLFYSGTTGEEVNPFGLPNDPTNAWRRQQGGIWVSTDLGATWTVTYKQSIARLLRHPNSAQSGTLFALGPAGTSDADDKTTTTVVLLESSDEGSTWTATASVPILSSLGTDCTTIDNAVGSLSYVGGTTTFYVGFFVYTECYAFFKSDDSAGALGASWTTITGAPASGTALFLGGQGWTNFAVLADPTLAYYMYVGGTDRIVFRVDTRTNSWQLFASPNIDGLPATPSTKSKTAPHADTRNMYWDSFNSELLVTNDGGLYLRTSPQLAANQGDWSTLSGDLAITEGYQAAYDPRSGAIILSAQDNSVMISQYDGSEASSGVWGYTLTGDGSSVAVDSSVTPARLYGANQYLGGWFSLPVNGGLNNQMYMDKDTNAVSVSQRCGWDGDNNCWNFVTTQAMNSEEGGSILVCTNSDGKCYKVRHPTFFSVTATGSMTRLEFDPAANAALSAFDNNGVLQRPLIQWVYGGRRNGVSYPNVVFAVGVYHVWARQVPAASMSAISVADYTKPNAAPSNPNNYVNNMTPFYNWLFGAFIVQHPADFYINIVIDDAGQCWLTTNFGKTFTNLNDPAKSNLLSVSGHTSVDTFGTGSGVFIKTWVNGVLPLVISTSLGMWVSFTPIYSNALPRYMEFVAFGAGSPHTMATSMVYSYETDALVVSMFGRGVWTMQGVAKALADRAAGATGTNTRQDSCVATGLYPNTPAFVGYTAGGGSTPVLPGGTARAAFNYTAFNLIGSGGGSTGSISDAGAIPNPGGGGSTGGGGTGTDKEPVTVSFALAASCATVGSSTSFRIQSDLLNALRNMVPAPVASSVVFLSEECVSDTPNINVKFQYVDGQTLPGAMLDELLGQAKDANSLLFDGLYTQYIIGSSIKQTSGPACSTCGTGAGPSSSGADQSSGGTSSTGTSGPSAGGTAADGITSSTGTVAPTSDVPDSLPVLELTLNLTLREISNRYPHVGQFASALVSDLATMCGLAADRVLLLQLVTHPSSSSSLLVRFTLSDRLADNELHSRAAGQMFLARDRQSAGVQWPGTLLRIVPGSALLAAEQAVIKQLPLVSFTLAYNLAVLPGGSVLRFCQRLVADIAALCSIAPHRIAIQRVLAGSVQVTFVVAPAVDVTADPTTAVTVSRFIAGLNNQSSYFYTSSDVATASIIGSAVIGTVEAPPPSPAPTAPVENDDKGKSGFMDEPGEIGLVVGLVIGGLLIGAGIVWIVYLTVLKVKPASKVQERHPADDGTAVAGAAVQLPAMALPDPPRAAQSVMASGVLELEPVIHRSAAVPSWNHAVDVTDGGEQPGAIALWMPAAESARPAALPAQAKSKSKTTAAAARPGAFPVRLHPPPARLKA